MGDENVDPAGPPPKLIKRSDTLGEVNQINNYKMILQLGTGAYGKVMLAQNVQTKENVVS
jgi:serine/threonine protein kinase